MADLRDLDHVVPLFDAYRQFYRQPSDLQGAREFLRLRMEAKQSVIFVAMDASQAIGFTQLYPSFTSSAMQRLFILNDLFVASDARRKGVGTALLRQAAQYAKQEGAVRMVLSTEYTNTAAQALYEREGWKSNVTFRTYNLAL